jgi:hypothetical protein
MRLFMKKKIVGFVYSALEDDERFRNAKVGDLIINKDKNPPWIVVDHTLGRTIVTKWPGKLFEVEILNPSREKSINKGLVKDVWYTRTFGVKIIRELTVDNLFGQNGKEICWLIDLTRNIDEQQVTLLAGTSNENNRDLYSKAWEKWIALTDKGSLSLDDNHYDILKVFPRNQRFNSPIREGLSIISSQFRIRAREILGEKAFIIDDEEQYLIPVWANACEKLLHAGMSFESYGLLTIKEKKDMIRPIIETFKK